MVGMLVVCWWCWGMRLVLPPPPPPPRLLLPLLFDHCMGCGWLSLCRLRESCPLRIVLVCAPGADNGMVDE